MGAINLIVSELPSFSIGRAFLNYAVYYYIMRFIRMTVNNSYLNRSRLCARKSRKNYVYFVS